MYRFKANLEIVGINPFVSVPDRILKGIFSLAGKDKGPIPIHGTVNGLPFKQTLVKYKGAWLLYINTFMLKDSPRRIGEKVQITVQFDSRDRTISVHPMLALALKENEEARVSFESLSPSRKKEILRYIRALKTKKSLEQNIKKTIDFLLGKGRFVGRDRP